MGDDDDEVVELANGSTIRVAKGNAVGRTRQGDTWRIEDTHKPQAVAMRAVHQGDSIGETSTAVVVVDEPGTGGLPLISEPYMQDEGKPNRASRRGRKGKRRRGQR